MAFPLAALSGDLFSSGLGSLGLGLLFRTGASHPPKKSLTRERYPRCDRGTAWSVHAEALKETSRKECSTPFERPMERLVPKTMIGSLAHLN